MLFNPADLKKGVFLHHRKLNEFLLIWGSGSGDWLVTDLGKNKTDKIDLTSSQLDDYDVVPRVSMQGWLDERKAELERRLRVARDRLFAAETDVRALECSSSIVRSHLRE